MSNSSESGNKCTVIDLFAGIGGISLGFQDAGFDVVAQVEQSEFCRNVLGHHFPTAHRHGDIRSFDGSPWRGVTVVAGGSPCQDFSKGNRKREGIRGERSGLWSEMRRVIEETQPRYVLWENVSNALNRGGDQVIYDLAEMGFSVEWRTLNAYTVGLNHRRLRLYVLAAHTSSIDVQGGSVSPLLQESDLQEQFARSTTRWSSRRDIPQPRSLRSANGAPYLMDRLRAIGNSVPVGIITAHAAAIKKHYKTVT